MMTRGPLDRVTGLLREAVNQAEEHETTPARRDEAIARLAEALRERNKRALRRRILIGGLAVAATVTLVGSGFLAARHRSDNVEASELGRVSDPAGAVTAVRDGHEAPIGGGDRVLEGTELRTPESAEAHLEFDTGTQVTLGAASRVRLVEQSKKKRFAVEAGSFTAKVAKLGPGERFIVTTPDAEIEVHGTMFRVSLATPDDTCAVLSRTRLEVTEGVVALRHQGVETRVAAGERWPRCASKAPTPSLTATPITTTPNPNLGATATPATPATPNVTPDQPATPNVTATPEQPATPRREGHAPSHASASSPPSSLAEQNDLFAAAMQDKRAGRVGHAITTLDRLLASYPQGQLAENASVERMRLLTGAEKKQAARSYLRRWPNGFARREAEGIAGEP